MELALISDIHGNLPALEAFQGYLQSYPIDQIICLGDVAINGPQPHETVECMQSWGIPIVMGNTDEWALDPVPIPSQDEESRQRNEILRWSMEQLTAGDLALLRTFQHQIELPLSGGRDLYCCHGAPGSYETIASVTTHGELTRLVSGTQASLVACGHTHVPMLRQVGEKWVINTGSLGRPFVHGPDGRVKVGLWADFARLTVVDKGMQISFVRIGYNVNAFFDAIRKSSMPHQDAFLAAFDANQTI